MKENIPFDDFLETPAELLQSREKKYPRKKVLGNDEYVYKMGKIEQNNILLQKKKSQKYSMVEDGESRAESQLPDDESDLCNDIFICNDDELKPQKEEQQIQEKQQEKSQERQQEKSQQKQEKMIEKKQKKIYTFDEEQSERQPQTFDPVMEMLQKDNQQLDQGLKLDNLQQNSENSSFSSSFSSNEEKAGNSVKGLTIMDDPLDGDIKIKITSKVQLLCSSLPPGIKLHCKLRKSSNLSTFINPQFDLFLNNGLNHIASAKKYPLAKRQIFKISTDINKYEEDSEGYIGSINSNYLHNAFWLLRPISTNTQLCKEFGSLVCSVLYEKIEKGKERHMKTLITKNQNVLVNKKLTQLQQKRINEFTKLSLQSRAPNAKQVEFEGKMSVKNFVLFDRDDSDYEYLRFEKESDHFFSLMIQHPLSPLEAFTVVLSRFDAELS